MKRRELIRHLRRHGCELLCEGSRHSWWHNPRAVQDSGGGTDSHHSLRHGPTLTDEGEEFVNASPVPTMLDVSEIGWLRGIRRFPPSLDQTAVGRAGTTTACHLDPGACGGEGAAVTFWI